MAQRNSIKDGQQKSMAFQAFNYKILVTGLLLVAAGFIAMYLENKAFGFISLYISPVLIIAGYIIVIFSIIMHPSDNESQEKSPTSG
ncbi:MAG TPA: hypothetical protein VE868_07905 [Balneolaceae bacterium]|nr:hypothetical protein [Balneolaceae bacterium]